MYRAADSENPKSPTTPLWVVVTSGTRSDCFELDGERCRAVVIGSAADVDFRIVDPPLAPVECYLERNGDEIWLVPGCRTNVIRVDSVTVERPMRLWRRCVVELAGISIDVRTREEPPTAPDHEAPTQHVEASATSPAVLSVRAISRGPA